MKRLVTLAATVLVLLGISLSHMVLAAPPPRVLVCHVITSRTLNNGNTVVIGQVISVPAPAVPAHLGHGDQLSPGTAAGDCCAFCLTEEGDSCPVRLD